MQHRPATMSRFDTFFWLEPAFWRRPEAPCHWLLQDPTVHDLGSQLARLDWEEPIRNEWGAWVGRFVEALTPVERTMLDQRGSPKDLPAPWNDPDYTPLPLNYVTEGAPGPGLYLEVEPGPVVRAWHSHTEQPHLACPQASCQTEEACAGWAGFGEGEESQDWVTF